MFLAPLFEDLPQASLAAIVIVAVAGFWDVASLRHFGRIRRSATVFSGLALAGVLALGVLQGLILAAGLSLAYVVTRVSRPALTVLAEEPDLVVRVEGQLLYPNAASVQERVSDLVRRRPRGRRRWSWTCRSRARGHHRPGGCGITNHPSGAMTDCPARDEHGRSPPRPRS